MKGLVGQYKTMNDMILWYWILKGLTIIMVICNGNKMIVIEVKILTIMIIIIIIMSNRGHWFWNPKWIAATQLVLVLFVNLAACF